MKRKKIIIGIDPDIDKSGVATINTESRNVQVECLSFPELVERFRTLQDKDNIVVVVEASWVYETNWHKRVGDSRNVTASKGYDVGRNHEVGRKIVECAQFYNIEVKEKRPLRKSWKGPDGKITHEELAYFVKGLPSRTNQEKRDAVLLAWDEAAYPIRVKPLR